jgi:tetratricopeptide (TPR) repeat protein
MTIKTIKPEIIKICLLGLLTGCAGVPDIHSDKHFESGLNDKSLDVLFATEFPVESEAGALARADQALQEGNLDKALFFYVRALQFNPENVELLAHIGEIQMQRNNLTMAKRAFLKARNVDATHAPSLEGLGLIYMSEGMHERAFNELKLAVANNDQLWRAHNALGVYADKADDFMTAQDHYNAALRINPDAAHVLNNRGYSKFLAGDVEGATLDFYEAANDRGFAQSWVNLGRIYAIQGSYDDAVTTYKHVMSEANAYNNTGHVAIKNGDFLLAKRFLDEAVRLSPTYFPAAEENLSLLESLQ